MCVIVSWRLCYGRIWSQIIRSVTLGWIKWILTSPIATLLFSHFQVLSNTFLQKSAAVWSCHGDIFSLAIAIQWLESSWVIINLNLVIINLVIFYLCQFTIVVTELNIHFQIQVLLEWTSILYLSTTCQHHESHSFLAKDAKEVK